VKSWTQKEDLVKAILDLAEQRVPRQQKVAIAAFINLFFHNASPEDILQRSADDLYSAALSAWKFIARRTLGAAKIRVFNPTMTEHGWQSSHTIVQIINDDMPFLVDSVTGNLVHEGINVHFVVHPILTILRDDKGERIDAQAPATSGPTSRPTSGPTSSGGKTFQESLIHLEIDSKSAPESLARIAAKLDRVLKDVRAAVEDWKPMINKMGEALEGLKLSPPAIAPEKVSEAQAFLAWLMDDNFTLLGYREFDHTGALPRAIDNSGLGILRDPDVHVFRSKDGLVAMSQEISEFLQQPEPMIITKANVRSMVHRVTHMDYIGIKKFDKSGKLCEELRFVGLFTSVAYSRRPQEIPYLRKKVDHVMERSGFDPRNHDGKILSHILENFPRDELFQISDDELLITAMGILHLQERPQAKIFVRRDKFERFVSVLVFIPRELYASGLRYRIEKILCLSFNGDISTRYAQLSNEAIARWHFIIRTKPGAVPTPNIDEINDRIIDVCRRWQDHLRDALTERWGEERAAELVDKYADAFSSVYREVFSAKIAVADIDKLEELKTPEDVRFNFYRLPEDPDTAVRLKIYHASRVIPLSDCLPMLENLGLKVIEEFGYNLEDTQSLAPGGCIHSFYLTEPGGHELKISELKARLEETLTEIWSGNIENDSYNVLVLRSGLTPRQVVILRAYSKYLRQLGLSYSEEYMRDCLTQNAAIAHCLVDLFETRFDPNRPDANREEAAVKIIAAINAELDTVQSLDQDRILRSYLNVADASLRTNYYQTGKDGQIKPCLAIKIRSSDVLEAPLPKPFAEIFVYSPRVEGVHLRFGPVARGGLRWSDRREDFRTEVLGLVKAQQVKNTIIVPVGAKGGFVPKTMPKGADREAIMAEGIACYKIFVSALLDVTDNLTPAGVKSPPCVLRRDGDDPYLVVAADKGTATFSDIANGIARDYGFWLDDAFASGGSQGYDHKKMAITARGAWVSVQRHFREIGIDVQKEPITVTGIGDMSGDVFGNGLLMSPVVKLCAAFDHRDIFLDPNPDAAAGFTERKRLFDLPRSSWQDYEAKFLSKGGGIFSRTLKSIPLSPEVQGLLGLRTDRASPIEVIRAILKAPVDLLWIGGIGTYVKASEQSHLDVGDRTNDSVRINGNELKAKVVGEGGNLGFTQLGRIEYAMTGAINGGRINTDAVDNSAGVDCSDHEVNIKIPLNTLMHAGRLTEAERDKLLIAMTDDVAHLVLRDNYLQTLTISLSEAAAANQLEAHHRLIIALEKEGRLNRLLEFLPSEEELAERAALKKGLTRPELAVLVAYAKMQVSDALVASPVIDDTYFEDDLMAYFPKLLGQSYASALKNHQLRREIIATILSNDLINRAGPSFLPLVQYETEAGIAEIIRAYVIMREVFDLKTLWQDIDELDYKTPATIQTLMHLDIADFSRRQTLWFLHNAPKDLAISATIARYRAGISHLRTAPDNILGDFERQILINKIGMLTEQGIAEPLARRVSNLEALGAACDICEVADSLARPVGDVAIAYFKVGAAFGLDWLRANAEMLNTEDNWDRRAVTSILEDILEQQRNLTREALRHTAKGKGGDPSRIWLAEQAHPVARAAQIIAELGAAGPLNVAKLGYAARHIRSLI
jgi:glutamate dehydrogenase